MPLMNKRSLRSLMRVQRIGRLATVDARDRPLIIPFCFVYDGDAFYSIVDEKPKRVAPEELARTRNIRANPEVALVVDHYEEDWLKLRFVLVRGRAAVLTAGEEYTRAVRMLRRKYQQYRKMNLTERPVIKIVPWKIVSWSAEERASPSSPRLRNQP